MWQLGKIVCACRLEVLDFDRSSDQAPWAVYHVPNGIVYLDIRYVNLSSDDASCSVLFQSMPAHDGIMHLHAVYTKCNWDWWASVTS